MLSINKIIEVVNSSLNLLCDCKKEKDIQDILEAQLNCEVRRTLSSQDYPNVEIDLIGDNFAIEVKLDQEYYSGMSQILVQKILYKIDNIILLHVNSYLNQKFSNGFKKLIKELAFVGILIDKREKKMEVVRCHE